MARQKSSFVLHAEYLPLRVFFLLLGALPQRAGDALAKFLVSTFVALLPKRRRLILEQLALAFPEKSEAERETIARQSLDNLARGLSTFARIPRLSLEDMKSFVVFEGVEHMTKALQQGKGMITFTAHYGCWELMAVYVTHFYPNIAMVVRPLDNPKLDAMITRVRGSGGGGVIDSKKVLKEGIRLLRNNGILGVLVDQNFYKGGVFVDFFGRPAATNTLVPILAHRTECVVLPMHNYWKDGKLHIVCEPPVTLSQNPDRAEAIGEDTQTLTRYVERWVRKDPGQWLWLHNRWKRRPLPGEPLFH